MSFSKTDPENITKTTNKEGDVIILSLLDKSPNNINNIPEEKFEIKNNLLNDELEQKQPSNNITLFNALYNSLISKDHKSFLFCIHQENPTLIEETVKQMDDSCITKFIEKSIDIFQSNSFDTRFIIPWIKNILKFKKFHIFSAKNIQNLQKIQIFIKNRTKYFQNLCLLKQKMNKINQVISPLETQNDQKNEIFLKKNQNLEQKDKNAPVIFEPILTYYESDDEEEKKKEEIKKNKMEIEGFEEIEKDEEEEEEEKNEEGEEVKEESEEDYIDEEIDNMDLDDKDKIELNKNKSKEDQIDKDNEDSREDEDDEDD